MFFFTWCGGAAAAAASGGGGSAAETETETETGAGGGGGGGVGATVNGDHQRVPHQSRRRRKMTRITNKTEDVIILRDISRFVWRGDRLSLKPMEEGQIELPSAGTFLRTGVVRCLAQGGEERLNIFLDDHHSNVSIRYRNDGGEFYLTMD